MTSFGFHPAVSTWFESTFGRPTEPQRQAWPAIVAGRHTLIAAPTGSGKTLAAFLAAIDSLIKEGLNGGLADETQVVYVSPLKALSNDIERNLQQPLAGIRKQLTAQGLPDVDIRVQVRTGDTTQADRAAMRKTPPHILVTTPESLYLLLTSESGRAMLATTRTVIVDEIHAVAATKRGSHLALSLERLTALAANRVDEPAAVLEKPEQGTLELPLEATNDLPVVIDDKPARTQEQSAGNATVVPLPRGKRRAEVRGTLASAADAATDRSRRITRVGLSATQKPIEEVARFLVGADVRPSTSSGRGPSTLRQAHDSGRTDETAGGAEPLKSVRAEPVEARTNSRSQPPEPDCTIIDTGHRRARDLALELPRSPLSAVMANEVWEELYDRLAELVQGHRTTLIFVNTRRLAERAARFLSERIGKEHVTSHHGSLAKESRFDAEQRLKHGELKALVATASLELGIDIGDVDLVCQIGSPRSIATFLQRAGRAGHSVTGTPKARLFPLTRDELIECTALLHAIEHGDLDRLHIPPKPLDVLAQQIVAEVAGRTAGAIESSQPDLKSVDAEHPYKEEPVGAEHDSEAAPARAGSGVSEASLYEQFQRAYPYRDLTRAEYTDVVRMLADGFSTRRGRRSAYLHRDAVNGVLRARKGARLTALTNGGAIPDTADYRVVLEPAGTPVGTVNEDFAVESLTGDIFQLGNTSYKILKIEPGTVRVEDAKGVPPNIPFWLGEAPARTDELSTAVSRLRAEVDVELGPHVTSDSLTHTRAWLAQTYRTSASAAEQIVDYLAAAKGVLHVVPTQTNIVFERFFDETGGMQLVIHAPFGNRINRAWGLALRKRFCRKFNFELQAAATEDAIVLSLGETHSFPLEEVARYLHSNSVHDILVQALLAAPLFTTRWRWSATIALAVKRFRGGRKNPAPLQRMDAEDLVAVVFPDQIACAENLAGEREIPDHPLVRQTIDDCLHEAMDIDGLIALLRRIEIGQVNIIARDLPHPSPLAQEILNAKPYAFLDDAPLEERRTQAVMSRSWLDPLAAGDLGRLDPDAIARVRAEAWPEIASADELHDALMLLGFVEEREGEKSGWRAHLDELIAARRATRLEVHPHPNPLDRSRHPVSRDAGQESQFRGSAGTRESDLSASLHVTALTYWVAAEQLPLLRALQPDAQLNPEIETPAEYATRAWTRESALVEILRARLQGLGPVTVDALAQSVGANASEIQTALLALESEGFVMRGEFTSSPSPLAGESRESTRAPQNTEWCERRLLARIHRYTVDRLRAEIEPVTAADFLRFLFEWQGVTTEPRAEGPQALGSLIEQLQGFEAAATAWESEILSARMQGYDPDWLDDLCRAGRVVWARLTPPKTNGGERAAGPVRGTPIALLPRRDWRYWQITAMKNGAEPAHLSSRAHAVAEFLEQHGASFFEEITIGTNLLKSEVEEALGELVALGRVQSDSFEGLRALLIPSDKRRTGYRRRRIANAIEEAGRWSLLRRNAATAETETVEHIARALLRRYGVVFRKLLTREIDRLPPWIELLRVYRRLEARGEIRGGRFVAGFSGEQYALPEAVPMLRTVRRKPKNEQFVSLSAADPLNLIGILTPGGRIPALAGNRVLYRDGVPIAIQVGGKAEFLIEVPEQDAWNARNALIRGVASTSSAAH